MRGQGEPDEEQVASFKQKLNTNLDVYEKILSKQPYLAGDVSINIPNIPSTGFFFVYRNLLWPIYFIYLTVHGLLKLVKAI
jgi:hypothetical protein